MDDLCLSLLVLCFFCFAYKYLLCHFRHLIRTILIKNNDVIEITTVADKLIFLQAGSNKSVGTIDVEFLISFSHSCSLNRVEVTYLCQTRMLLSVFFLQIIEPFSCDLYQISQVTGNVFQLLLDLGNQFICLILIKLKNTLHLDFKQMQQVITCHLAYEIFLERFKSFVNILESSIGVLCIFEWLSLIDALLNEDSLQ